MFRDPSNVPGDGVCSAQALAAAALEAIGKIRTASGSVTVMRADGEIVRVSVGDLVYRGDTIETEADGAVGITFADGTAFDLSAAARLVLNEFVCDPAGTPNSALFSLVARRLRFRCRQGSQDRRPQDRYAFRNDPRQRARIAGSAS